MKSENLSNILKSSGFKNIELDNIIESKYILKRSGATSSLTSMQTNIRHFEYFEEKLKWAFISGK